MISLARLTPDDRDFILNHYPLCLMESEQYERLSTLLTSYEFVREKIRTGNIAHVTGTFRFFISSFQTRNWDANGLEFVNSLLLYSSDILTRHPDSLLQCAKNYSPVTTLVFSSSVQSLISEWDAQHIHDSGSHIWIEHVVAPKSQEGNFDVIGAGLSGLMTRQIACSPAGETVAIASGNKVFLYDLDTKSTQVLSPCEWNIESLFEMPEVWDLAFASAKELVAVFYRGHRCFLTSWNLITLEMRTTPVELRSPSDEFLELDYPTKMCLSPNGEMVAWGGWDHIPALHAFVEVQSRRSPVPVLVYTTKSLRSISFDKSSSRLIIITDSWAIICDLQTRKRRYVFHGLLEEFRDIVLSEDAGYVYYCDRRGRLFVHRTASNQWFARLHYRRQIQIPQWFGTDSCNCIDLTSNGELIALGREDGSVLIVNVVQAKVIYSGRPLTSGADRVRFLVDGLRLVVGSLEHDAVRIAHWTKWRSTETSAADEFDCPTHRTQITALAIVADGTVVVSGDAAGCVVIWDTGIKKARTLLADVHGTGVVALCHVKKTRLVASSGKDGSIALLNIDTGKVVERVKIHSGRTVRVLSSVPNKLIWGAVGSLDSNCEIGVCNIHALSIYESFPIDASIWAMDVAECGDTLMVAIAGIGKSVPESRLMVFTLPTKTVIVDRTIDCDNCDQIALSPSEGVIATGSSVSGSYVEPISCSILRTMRGLHIMDKLEFETDLQMLLRDQNDLSHLLAKPLFDRVTVVIDRSTNKPVAYTPADVNQLRCSDNGKIWAGYAGKEVYIMRLRNDVR